MAVTKRIRYEVLRRDNYTCRYCGAAAPDVVLNADHVVPVALGGSDDPSNLVTACQDCNSGKASTAPDSPLVDDVAASATRWRAAMLAAADELRADRVALQACMDAWKTVWDEWRLSATSTVPIPTTWRTSLSTLLEAGASIEDLINLIPVAMESTAAPDNTFRYFCGCAWNQVRHIQGRAQQMLAVDETDPWAPAADNNHGPSMGSWDSGYEEGWAAGLAAGRASTAPRERLLSPVPAFEELLKTMEGHR